ncbi:hypothetical protein NC652_039856 [Populus alba x Populus x berolinensis]|nr:hypothetical protein NC652_039856 [Populus alba x Populus x berolinensis]
MILLAALYRAVGLRCLHFAEIYYHKDHNCWRIFVGIDIEGHLRAGGDGEWETGIRCRGKERKRTGRRGRVGVGRGGRVVGRVGFCRNHFQPRFRLWSCKGCLRPCSSLGWGIPVSIFRLGEAFAVS